MFTQGSALALLFPQEASTQATNNRAHCGYEQDQCIQSMEHMYFFGAVSSTAGSIDRQVTGDIFLRLSLLLMPVCG